MGLLDILKEPEGVGLLSAVAGYAANARRGTPINNLGAGAIAGLSGYSSAVDGQEKRQNDALMRQYHQMQIAGMQDTLAQKQMRDVALQGLSGPERQQMILGVPYDKILDNKRADQFLAGMPDMSVQQAPVQLPPLGAAQGTGAYNLNETLATPEGRDNAIKGIAALRAAGDNQTADQITAALVKQGAIQPPTRPVMPNADAVARYAMGGSLAGIKGAGEVYNYAKDFLKPDWQQVDSGGQIQFINRNAGAMPTIGKTETPEIKWQREKFGNEQSQNNANQVVSREAELRKEFAGLQTSQDWWSVQPVLQTARDAAKVDNKAADLNLIYAVAKLYDPGSVVREGETTMQVKSGSPAEQFQGMFNSVAGGGRLTPEQRSKIMQQVESRARGYEDAFNSRADQYRDIASRYGIDHRNIITAGSVTANRGEQNSPKPSGQFSAEVGGKTYYFPDAKSLANFKLKAGVR